ncbi:MAG TPA: ribonuclease P protein subunit [Thermoplasmata archaeon]|nr:ribonuclease P protein subunit [Thermoplasmata archaeon]
MKPRPASAPATAPTPEETTALAGEILGAPVVVDVAPGLTRLPLRGTLVDETLHLLHVRRDGDHRIIKVPKAGLSGAIFLGDRELPLRGDLLRVRPEDRTKRLLDRGHRSAR